MSDSEDSTDYYAEIENAANKAKASLLPTKSKLRYERTYNIFKEWLVSKKIKEDINETILLAYFNERADALKSRNSLWCEYSMLKLTMCVKTIKTFLILLLLILKTVPTVTLI